MSTEDYRQGYRDGYNDAMKQVATQQNPFESFMPEKHVNSQKTDVIIELRKKIEALKDSIQIDVENTDGQNLANILESGLKEIKGVE
jgi:hypothetical protein